MTATIAVLASAHFRDGGTGTGDRVVVGRTCRSTLERDLELSCGTYGFGDLRFVCPTGRATTTENCARTVEVEVRNTGAGSVNVTVIGGPRQGDRRQSSEESIAPGQSTVLRPGNRQWLFDITLRGPGPEAKRLTVTGVR
ncbi:hypothetical protein ACFWBV_04745 [Streptomyces sp. NPDC060030]|uniref:hypothetical protein n=1 Tax=Streptomyces sp. NPDC060030 TaxID=3347042 RepID=UPI0036C666D1